jgi:hypothetical protein
VRCCGWKWRNRSFRKPLEERSVSIGAADFAGLRPYRILNAVIAAALHSLRSIEWQGQMVHGSGEGGAVYMAI